MDTHRSRVPRVSVSAAAEPGADPAPPERPLPVGLGGRRRCLRRRRHWLRAPTAGETRPGR